VSGCSQSQRGQTGRSHTKPLNLRHRIFDEAAVNFISNEMRSIRNASEFYHQIEYYQMNDEQFEHLLN